MLIKFHKWKKCEELLCFNYRAKVAHGVLSGKYSVAPEKDSQETTEQQADQVHLYFHILCKMDQKLISPYNIIFF